jgi:hypothetical protein
MIGTVLSAGILPQPAAQIQPVPARNHDVQKKHRRRLPLRIRHDLAYRRMYGRTVNPAASRWY